MRAASATTQGSPPASDRGSAVASAASRRAGVTLAAFGVLTSVYLVYAVTVSPQLTPPALHSSTGGAILPPQPPPPQEAVEMARQWLPAQPWAADEGGYILRSENRPDEGAARAFVYFEDWEPTDSDKAVRFKPFAMVWCPAGFQPGDTPYTFEADSAYVRFASRFDVTDADPGRVVGGALYGPVRIRGPDGLVILGRDFTFSEDAMRIWTADPVRIAYGPHRGTAIGLQADLIPDPEARRQNKLAVAGLRSVRLLRDVALDLRMESQAGDDGRARPPRLAAIRSVGRFEYQVGKQTGIFEENVRVDSPEPDQPDQFDRLRCDVLTLLFEPKPDEEPRGPETVAAAEVGAPRRSGDARRTPDAPAGGFQGPDANLAFRRLIADGPHVVLVSDRNDLKAVATRVIYDAHTRVAQLSDPRPARVVQGANELHSPEITLEHAEGGQITSLWCSGPGWLRAFDRTTGQVSFDATWEKMLRKYPDSRSTLEIFELEERAVVRQPGEQVGLAAGFIRMWVERPGDQPLESDPEAPYSAAVSARAPPPPRGGRAAAGGGPAADDRSSGYRPRRMLALRDVAFVSPGMHGQTPRMEVRFDDAPQAVSPGAPGVVGSLHDADHPAVPRAHAGPHRSASLTSRFVPGSEQPSGRDSVPAGVPSASPPPRRPVESADEPVEVRADLIRVQVLLVPRPPGRGGAADGREFDAHVAHVWTGGNVHITQAHASGEPPLAITGQRAEMFSEGGEEQVLHVYGQPAHIDDRGLHIEGRAIHFDRAANQAAVDGAGVLRLPVRQDLEGRPLQEPKLLDVWWGEQMTFDGRAARFYGQVRARLDESEMRSEEMDVLLRERISFRTSPGDAGRPRDVDVERVVCRDRVEFHHYVYEDSKLTEIRRGRVAWFELDQLTGRTDARGPGWIRFWRRGRGKRAALTPQASVQANQPMAPDASEWEFTQVDFSGRAEGNIRDRRTTFHDRVRILYGPVERPLATIELDNLPPDAGWMSSDTLWITQHEVRDAAGAENAAASYMELQAMGNAQLEGRSFNAQADVISYDESKGLYILRAEGKRTATVWHQERPGAEASGVNAQRIEFIPSRNQSRIIGTRGATGIP